MMKTSQAGRHKSPLPMIIVYEVKDIGPIHDLLKEVLGDQYSLKLAANDGVEIQVKDRYKFGQVIKALKDNKNTFEIRKQNKKETYKVILRNMHPSTNIDTIVRELALHDHKVVSIYNVKNPTTNEPMPIFHIELEPRDNNGEIYSLTELSNMIVAFEPHCQKKPFHHQNSQSSGFKDSSSDHSPTGTKTSDKKASRPPHPASSNATSTGNTPVAYVQPIRSRTTKTGRPRQSTPQNSVQAAQEQLATLDRLSNLEVFVNSAANSLENTLLLTATLIRRLS